MSFATQEDVFSAPMEPILHGLFEEFADGKPVTPYPFPAASPIAKPRLACTAPTSLTWATRW